MTDWNPGQYLKFEQERTQPVYDLIARIPLPESEVKRIVDVGCGPGNSTAALKERFPNAYILGIDSSQGMIDAAKSAYPLLDFMLCDASASLHTLPGGFDVVFSNACIQWVPDHNVLIPALVGLLRKGGCLAVQTPMNYKEPIHIIIERLVREVWQDKLKGSRIFYNLEQSAYYDILSEICSTLTLWETIYFHNLRGHGDIIEWYRSTGLRPYLSALSPEDAAKFEADVYEQLLSAYPLQANGSVIFRFPRFFFVATK